MPYDPSDLRLPPWLMRAMDRAVGSDLHLGPWHLGLTRPGALFLATLLGVAAAAVYSGNNLLYLCGAMFASFGAATLVSGMRLLRRLPPLSSLMPDHTLAGVSHVLRETAPAHAPFPALVDAVWQDEHEPLRLLLRLDRDRLLLSGRMRAECRGIQRFGHLLLQSSAPLGLWRLGLTRQESYEWIVAPAPLAMQQGHAGSRRMTDASGNEWQDLRTYMPGDLRSRIHWRKLPAQSADPRQWLVKRFASPPPEETASLLRIDLRLPERSSPAALDHLLGQAVSWLLQETGKEAGERRLVVGHAQCDPASDEAWRLLAGATAEAQPPAGKGGLLLSLIGPT